MFGGPGGSWDFGHAMRLNAIFFLVQADEDEVLPVKAGEAACLLTECIEQVGARETCALPLDLRRDCRLQRFDNVSRVVREVPCFMLRLSLEGAFWRHLDTALQRLTEAPRQSKRHTDFGGVH